MASNFPTSLDNLMTTNLITDGTTKVKASHINQLNDAVDKLQAKVGINDSTVATSLDFALKDAYVMVSDQKTNADGGASVATTWNTRVLNTEDSDTGSLCSLASNQITLAAGTYRCRVTAPAYNCGDHALRLRNTTADTTLLQGAAMEALSCLNRAELVGQFTVAAAQVLEVQHYTQSVDSTGLGKKVFTDATPNVYTIAEFWKIS